MYEFDVSQMRSVKLWTFRLCLMLDPILLLSCYGKFRSVNFKDNSEEDHHLQVMKPILRKVACTKARNR